MAQHASSSSRNPANDTGAALVGLAGQRLSEFRAHRQNVDSVMSEIEGHIAGLRKADFPITFKRLDTQTAEIRDIDGAKVMELRISRLKPVMLYPADHMQGAMGGQPDPRARAGMGRQGRLADIEDAEAEDIPMQPRRTDEPMQPRIPGMPGFPFDKAGETASGSSRGPGKDAEVLPPGAHPEPGEDGRGGRKGMTVEEIRAAAGGAKGKGKGGLPQEIPEGAIMFDPSRGLPQSPVASESMQIMTKSNIAGQPQEVEFIYDMANPIRNMSFAAHIADVAAYLKDLHERPAAERTGDKSPFAPEKGPMGFLRPR
jgi:hypothetical protein